MAAAAAAATSTWYCKPPQPEYAAVADYSYESKYDPFCTRSSTTPSCFPVERLPDDDVFFEQLDQPLLSFYDKYGRTYEDMKPLINYQVSFILSKMPQLAWKVFRRHGQPAHLKQAIEYAATIIFMLSTKDILYVSANYTEQAPQLNKLWGLLSDHFALRSPVEEACKFLMLLLKTDTESYSLVTETDVSHMVEHYCIALKFDTSFPTPYKVIGSVIEENQWFKDIAEVVNGMECPPILKADDYTRLLIKILNGDVHKEYLLSSLNLSSPYSGEEQERSQLLVKRAFEYLVFDVINAVRSWMTVPLVSALTPLYQLYHMNYHFHLSPEVGGLINVAEIRRIALGCRFISRSHLLWAFYECGHVLPPKIRMDVELNSDNENHPPYHIYLASMMLASLFSERLRLENFMFAVIYLKNIEVDRYQMIVLAKRYQVYLKDLDEGEKSSSNPKRLRSGEFKS